VAGAVKAVAKAVNNLSLLKAPGHSVQAFVHKGHHVARFYFKQRLNLKNYLSFSYCLFVGLFFLGFVIFFLKSLMHPPTAAVPDQGLVQP
jgi:hypothetical protein